MWVADGGAESVPGWVPTLWECVHTSADTTAKPLLLSDVTILRELFVFWVHLPCSGFVSWALIPSQWDRHIWEFRANLWPSYAHLLKKMWVEIILQAILFHFEFFRCGEVLNVHATPLFGFSHYPSGSDFFSPLGRGLGFNTLSTLIHWATHFHKFSTHFIFRIILKKDFKHMGVRSQNNISVEEMQGFMDLPPGPLQASQSASWGQVLGWLLSGTLPPERRKKYLVILGKNKKQKTSTSCRFPGTTVEVSWFSGYFQALRIK